MEIGSVPDNSMTLGFTTPGLSPDGAKTQASGKLGTFQFFPGMGPEVYNHARLRVY
jgi:hypothetical protein